MLIGQMNWIAIQTRPDLLFSCCELASSMKNATVNDVIKANKVLKNLCNEDIKVRTPELEYRNFKFTSYSDASYANLTDDGSQGAHVIFLTNNTGLKLSPIGWKSKRIKRVVKSTLADKVLSLVEAAESYSWLQNLLNEITGMEKLNIECKTDGQSVFNAVHSMTALLDKRLRVDVAILREMIGKGKIKKVIWVPTNDQLADCLTKRGSSPSKLLQVLTTNTL